MNQAVHERLCVDDDEIADAQLFDLFERLLAADLPTQLQAEETAWSINRNVARNAIVKGTVVQTNFHRGQSWEVHPTAKTQSQGICTPEFPTATNPALSQPD